MLYLAGDIVAAVEWMFALLVVLVIHPTVRTGHHALPPLPDQVVRRLVEQQPPNGGVAPHVMVAVIATFRARRALY